LINSHIVKGLTRQIFLFLPHQKIDMHPLPIFSNLSNSARWFILIGLLIFGSIFSVLLAYLIIYIVFGVNTLQGTSLLDNIQYIRTMQIFNQVGIFILPPVLFAIFTETRPVTYLGFTRVPVNNIVIIAFLILCVSPIVNQLMVWNEAMYLPAQLEGLENWMKASEESANAITEKMLSYTDSGSFAINIFMMAFLPALGEELLFRATAIRLFNRTFKNIHVSVWVSAILFSAFHLQFYGFLPRMFLGLVFGYLFIWSGSIWIPFIAHLVNNGVVIVVSWLYAAGYINQSADDFGNTDSIIIKIASIIITSTVLFYAYKSRKRDLTS